MLNNSNQNDGIMIFLLTKSRKRTPMDKVPYSTQF